MKVKIVFIFFSFLMLNNDATVRKRIITEVLIYKTEPFNIKKALSENVNPTNYEC
jgi:hypothetical protein